jgi:ankyrin repeat protein
LLVELGADVNCRGSTGIAPIHAVIAWDRDPEVLEALLARGADLTSKYQNKTAAELATSSQSEHRGRYLELLGTGGNGE